MSLFTEWLKNQIKSSGLPQNQICVDTGIHGSYLSRWKHGQAEPDMDNLMLLSYYFDEDPERLFEMAGKTQFIRVYRSFLPQSKSTNGLIDRLQQKLKDMQITLDAVRFIVEEES